MKHLIISRELPPAPYAAGGIGAYVAKIARLLAESGDTVHVIGQRWEGAPKAREDLLDGRLVLHRIAAWDAPPVPASQAERARRELRGLRRTAFPEQWFAWSAALLAERLVEQDGVEVIEAQEWEAPLYYFLLRRQLGLGPERRPPCIVHLHSPSVVLHQYEGPWEASARRDCVERMEAFCIRTADALLCPSRSLATEAARRFDVPAEAIELIPLPVGFAGRLQRDHATWAGGSICFVGRLEPRKGVIEWVEAARRVAAERPGLSFDFIGADTGGLRRALRKQIGHALAPRFRFHGPKSPKEIPAYLARARAAVVPSRWENFPNVCIEAMASGLPVIATPYGAMADLIEDGRSGWIAADLGVAGLADSLADALRRCLAHTPEERAAMGERAAARVRRICDNAAVAAAHRRFRAGVLARGAVRSAASAALGGPPPRAQVVVVAETRAEAEDLVRSLAAQTTPPAAVAALYRRPGPERRPEPEPDPASRVLWLHAPDCGAAQAWNRGFARLAAGPPAGFWLFLDEHDRLEPDCLAQMARAFASRGDLGVVSPWTQRTGQGGGLDARPCPSLANQLTGNDVAPASGFNARALCRPVPFRPGLPREFDVWALANEVIASGWAAATLPGLLARRAAAPDRSPLQSTALRALRAEALHPFETAENRLALELVGSFVPLALPLSAGQRLRRRLAHAATAVLLRPGHVARRCLGLTRLLILRGALAP